MFSHSLRTCQDIRLQVYVLHRFAVAARMDKSAPSADEDLLVPVTPSIKHRDSDVDGFADLVDDTPEKVSEHADDEKVSEHSAFGFGPHLNGQPLPIVDKDFNCVLELDHDGEYFVLLSSWILQSALKAATLAPRDFSERFACRISLNKSGVMAFVQSGIRSALGKRTRTTWYVNRDRTPLGVFQATIGKESFSFIKSYDKKLTYAIKYSKSNVLRLVSVIADYLQQPHSSELRQDSDESSEHIVKTAIATAISTEDGDKLRRINIRWQPSKCQFVRDDKKLVIRFSNAFRKKQRTLPRSCAVKAKAFIRKTLASILDSSDFPDIDPCSDASMSETEAANNEE